MEALRQAREKRGLPSEKCAALLGISDSQLRNLERNHATRETIPGNVRAFTMVKILEFFPELDISDFVAGTELSVR